MKIVKDIGYSIYLLYTLDKEDEAYSVLSYIKEKLAFVVEKIYFSKCSAQRMTPNGVKTVDCLTFSFYCNFPVDDLLDTIAEHAMKVLGSRSVEYCKFSCHTVSY